MKSRSSKGHKNYDLIFREHIEKFVLSIGTVLFGLDIASTVRLETSLRKVVSRDVDSLFQIRTHDGRELILHVEFQSSDDPDIDIPDGLVPGIASRYIPPAGHSICDIPWPWRIQDAD